MVNSALLVAFIPTFALVSFTPGLCMTLALTLGLSIGVRKTLWMIVGELSGVALVAVTSLCGIATLMLAPPQLFITLKIAGGAYLAYLGMQMWQARGKIALTASTDLTVTKTAPLRWRLLAQGFVTAVANPKGWAFFMVLLPPFVDRTLPLTGQLSVLILLIVLIECIALLTYAAGGQTLKRWLSDTGSLAQSEPSIRWVVDNGWCLVGLWQLVFWIRLSTGNGFIFVSAGDSDHRQLVGTGR